MRYLLGMEGVTDKCYSWASSQSWNFAHRLHSPENNSLGKPSNQEKRERQRLVSNYIVTN